MQQTPIAPVVLVILDGWGYSSETAGNAVLAAKTPIIDSLWEVYPHTLINASGKFTGLVQHSIASTLLRFAQSVKAMLGG